MIDIHSKNNRRSQRSEKKIAVGLFSNRKRGSSNHLKTLFGFFRRPQKRFFSTTKILRLSEDLPMVVEIIDTEEKIESLFQEIDHSITEGIVTWKKPGCACTVPAAKKKTD